MGVISERRLELVRGLVKSVPVKSLRLLESSLSLTPDPALGEIRMLVSLELESHHIKDSVFQPYIAMFSAREDGVRGVQFPPWVLNRLWKALERLEPQIYAEARMAIRGLRVDDTTPVAFFRLVHAAAEITRERPTEIVSTNASAEDLATLTEFALYLDLHRLLRGALARLPDWMGRIDAEKAAVLKLMFKDACRTSEEGGVRFIEALFANIDDGVLIMKLVATVSDRPNDRFLSESELSDFGERLLETAEARVAVLETLLKPRNKDMTQLAEAGVSVAQCLMTLQGIEQNIELSRDGPWGKRVADMHKAIAALVESRLKTVEKTIEQGLPLKTERIFGRASREVAVMTGASDELYQQVVQTLTFISRIRSSATQGGYASLLSKTVQAAEVKMDAYFDVLLGVATHDDTFDAEALMACFERVTDLMQILFGDDKASVARRRVASADIFRTPKNVA